MEKKYILSICIATYNRSKMLLELVNELLAWERGDVEISVTDNASTDDTIEQLQKIDNPRLTINRNPENIGGVNNTIQSIYNAKGKYALYCNDRDLIDVQKLELLIEELYKEEYSFIRLTPRTRKNNNMLKVYQAGCESFCNHEHNHHPTGMIFNVDIVKKHIAKEEIFQYEEALYVYDFLMREVVLYEKTAIYDLGGWYERGEQVKIANKSGFAKKAKRVYFFPECVRYTLTETIRQCKKIMDCNKFTESQMAEMIKAVIDKHFVILALYKMNIFSRSETAHYGLERRFISLRECLAETRMFSQAYMEALQKNNYPENIVKACEKDKGRYIRKMVLKNMKQDLCFIRDEIKYRLKK